MQIVYSKPPSPSGLQITSAPDNPMPTFTWTYTDPDGDPQAAFQFQIASENTFLAPERDSGKVQSAQSTYTENNALQSQAEPYYARVKVWDSKGAESGWSDPVMFAITGPQVISYEYDQAGNRTKKIDGDITTTYNYNNMNQLISMTENGVTTNFFYDANGNQKRKEKGIEKWYYTYDFENRLTKVEHFDGTQTTVLGEYYYDGDGKRIKKQENGETAVYIYMGIQVIYEKTIETGKTVRNISGVARIEKLGETETISYLHSDHLGSLRGVTDSSGNLQSTMTYDPFGEVRSGSSNGIRYTYTGKEQDGTGLYYYGARYFDPKVGRFITRDTFSGVLEDPQTQNRYSYVTNNPMKYSDPTGKCRGGKECGDDEDEDGITSTSSSNNSTSSTKPKSPSTIAVLKNGSIIIKYSIGSASTLTVTISPSAGNTTVHVTAVLNVNIPAIPVTGMQVNVPSSLQAFSGNMLQGPYTFFVGFSGGGATNQTFNVQSNNVNFTPPGVSTQANPQGVYVGFSITGLINPSKPGSVAVTASFDAGTGYYTGESVEIGIFGQVGASGGYLDPGFIKTDQFRGLSGVNIFHYLPPKGPFWPI